MKSLHKTSTVIADAIGFEFLEKIFSTYNTEDITGKLASSIGYNRNRAVELMNSPDKLRIIDMVKIAKKAGFDIEISLIKREKDK